MTNNLKISGKYIFVASMTTMFIANYEKAIGGSVNFARSISIFLVLLLLQIVAVYLIKKNN